MIFDHDVDFIGESVVEPIARHPLRNFDLEKKDTMVPAYYTTTLRFGTLPHLTTDNWFSSWFTWGDDKTTLKVTKKEDIQFVNP